MADFCWKNDNQNRQPLVLLLCELAGLGFGTSLGPVVPVVKPMGTALFTVFAAVWTFLWMALFFTRVDVPGTRQLAFPLRGCESLSEEGVPMRSRHQATSSKA